jgi:hypothetical protein
MEAALKPTIPDPVVAAEEVHSTNPERVAAVQAQPTSFALAVVGEEPPTNSVPPLPVVEGPPRPPAHHIEDRRQLPP